MYERVDKNVWKTKQKMYERLDRKSIEEQVENV